jgi:AraC family transcriptional regulator of adaptative response / DNA-3-methyladenine glycosylase II
LAIVRRGLRLIDDGFLDDNSVDDLAGMLGVGMRHLHRLFLQHVGIAPGAIAQTCRIRLAKRLLEETTLQITEVALNAGFGSVRRFNSAFHEMYGRAPREVRKQLREGRGFEHDGEIILKLPYRPPYDWIHVHSFLARHAIARVESIDGCSYSRALCVANREVLVSVRPSRNEPALELRVRGAVPGVLLSLASAARTAFDIASDPERITEAFKDDCLIGPIASLHRGVRIPGTWDPFECAVRAVLGERISTPASPVVVSRLVRRAGRPLKEPYDGITHLFPTPSDIYHRDLQGLGISKSRISALKNLAHAVLHGLDLSRPTADVIVRLTQVDGIGPRLAQYVALRGLGEPDAFPASDLDLCRLAGSSEHPLSAAELESRSEAWRPWRSYAALYLCRQQVMGTIESPS